MTCECRTSATCPDHLEEADLTLRHVPMGSQPRIVACNCGAEDDEIHDFGCPLYPSHAPHWPAA